MQPLKTLLAATALAATPAAAMADDHNKNSDMSAESAMNAPGDITTIIVYETGDYNPSYLASAWLGESVYNMNGEELGDVTDLVINGNNELAGAVLSVGGLWDIGDTDVIVPVSQFNITRMEDEEPRLRIDYTEDQLLNMAEAHDGDRDYGMLDTGDDD